MSSDLTFQLTEAEAKALWQFMSSREELLDYTLSGLRKKLESDLWDRLSIEEMVMAGSAAEGGNG